jgi:hypothetical protein
MCFTQDMIGALGRTDPECLCLALSGAASSQRAALSKEGNGILSPDESHQTSRGRSATTGRPPVLLREQDLLNQALQPPNNLVDLGRCQAPVLKTETWESDKPKRSAECVWLWTKTRGFFLSAARWTVMRASRLRKMLSTTARRPQVGSELALNCERRPRMLGKGSVVPISCRRVPEGPNVSAFVDAFVAPAI